jgi:hypothetical protein
VSNKELIASAERVLQPRKMANGRFVGNVGATLLSAEESIKLRDLPHADWAQR